MRISGGSGRNSGRGDDDEEKQGCSSDSQPEIHVRAGKNTR